MQSDIIFTLGIACIVAGVCGGGLKAAAFEIPVIQSYVKQIIIIVIGVALVVLDGRIMSVILPHPDTSPGSIDGGGVVKENNKSYKYSIWKSAGSTFNLVSDASGYRKITVNTPSEGLVSEGVKQGDVVFEGRRAGDKYLGKYFLHKSGCAVVSFDVSGSIINNEMSIILSGMLPKLNAKCEVVNKENIDITFNFIQNID